MTPTTVQDTATWADESYARKIIVEHNGASDHEVLCWVDDNMTDTGARYSGPGESFQNDAEVTGRTKSLCFVEITGGLDV